MKRNAFTIIEILAVIVIMSIIMTIAVPAVLKSTDRSKERLYCSKLEVVEKSAERYADDNFLINLCEIDGEEYGCESITIQNLINENYIDADGLDGAFIDPRDQSSINTMEILVYSKNNRSYAYINEQACPTLVTSVLSPDELNNIKHTATFVLDGGTWNGTSPQTLKEGQTLFVNDPVKSNYLFTGWTIVGNDSDINDQIFTMGVEDTILTANWEIVGYLLTVDAAGGTWSGTSPQILQQGEEITVANPTKSGTVFLGWTVSGTGSSIDDTTFTMGTADTILTANWLTYTYTGTSTFIDDGNGNWRIKFLTNGTFTPTSTWDIYIEAFLVGGGGGGGTGAGSSNFGGSGGGGGYVTHDGVFLLTKDTPYTIAIGAGGGSQAAGGSTTAFGYSATGGAGGILAGAGGAGGSGGGSYGGSQTAGVNGGSDGSDGTYSSPNIGGIGQSRTTREFGSATGDLYAGGGGSGAFATGAGLGGAGGGGNGANRAVSGNPGTANTGGGGGGAGALGAAGGSGGSGIVVIKKSNFSYTVGNTTKYSFTYSGILSVVNENTDTWQVKFLKSGTFIPSENMTIDAFLVGGGGGGASGAGQSNYAGSGAGGGYTTNATIALTANSTYSIIIGNGGASGVAGQTSSAFGYTAAGGAQGVNGGAGGAGGSGGGAANFQAVGKNGGSNGGNGVANGANAGGVGQGTTTRAFANALEDLYAGGGASGAFSTGAGTGGSGGGGDGANRAASGYRGTANTGGGGGGAGALGGTGGGGGSGIVVIRNHQE